MKNYRGFKLGRRLTTAWRRVFRRRRCHRLKHYLRLRAAPPLVCSTMREKLLNWTRLLGRSLRRQGGGGIQRLGDDRGFRSPLQVEAPPKGYLAVYVGDEWSSPQRYVVPVIYFNHPLFGELLRESEEEFGFHHPGGITIPCAVTQFERVRTRIAAGGGAEISRKSDVFHWS